LPLWWPVHRFLKDGFDQSDQDHGFIPSLQFSLLKSVQPDSASPVHGFNFMVTYSRPLYFCALAVGLLLLDWAVPSMYPNLRLAWHWRPSWLRLYHDHAFLISPRDMVAAAIPLLPVAFTLGLLPQVNTLCMHGLEQLDMHLFGGTASLTLFSAFYSLARSGASFGFLIGLFQLVQHFSPAKTVNTLGFSAFVSTTLALAYLLSRFEFLGNYLTTNDCCFCSEPPPTRCFFNWSGKLAGNVV
jgi:hypothetical protein